jgi:hypothetical protein
MLFHRRWLLFTFGCLGFLLLFADPGRTGDSDYFSPDMLALQGRWVRADAPYIIELRQGKNKRLEATYFNRRYIHVDKTETPRQDGVQYVLIRLQDVNYAGSTYVLGYNRAYDSLEGVYIHGASGQRFDVAFTREKTGSKLLNQ